MRFPIFQTRTYQSGQSLVEVLVALTLFTLAVAAVGSLVLDANVSVRGDLERTQATLYVREGLEAARSIRDDNFDSLTSGSHGIALSGGHWVFAGSYDSPEQFTRSMVITDVDANNKNIEATVAWNFAAGRPASTSMTLLMTRWQK